ncbi:hypothetical protein GTQ99_11780 [Kineococcus sp. T13]|uniref:hypothetical protein n=1 Tax=Kineococcus vitellinus TaxID=2696565 RepID=UPI001412A2EF|nr:hypothetical protein [Kineococcus vitellinus]NAZ76085.1 hypothetical protein [Kineococcus vitellinus]
MNGPRIDGAVARFAQEAGTPLEERAGRVEFGDPEVRHTVSREGEDVVVTRSSRGREQVELRTDHAGAADRYLLHLLGSSWRSARSLPNALFDDLPPLGEGFSTTRPERARVTLHWREGGRGFSAARLRPDEEKVLAHLLRHATSEIEDAYRDTSGRRPLPLPTPPGR